MKRRTIFFLTLLAAAPSSAANRTDWDLHVHSDCSDGVLSAERLVGEAAREGVRVLALSDHDTFDCLAEARAAAERAGIRLLPAIELSTEDDSVHILGIDVDPRNPVLLAAVEHMRRARIDRLHAILGKLAALTDAVGRPIAISMVEDLLLPRTNAERRKNGLPERSAAEAVALGEAALLAELRGQLTRPDVAEALIRRGFVKNRKEAFDKYLGDTGPAAVPMDAVSAVSAIDAIHASGGIASLAHPYILFRKKYPWSIGGQEWKSAAGLVGTLLDAGLDGVEIFRADGGAFTEDRWALETILLDHPRPAGCEVLRTPGSDYHAAPGQPPLRVGHVEIPEAELGRIGFRLGVR